MTDIVVYSQAWSGDHPSEEGEEANGLLHGRVVLDGKEIPGIFEVRLIFFRLADREDLSDFRED